MTARLALLAAALLSLAGATHAQSAGDRTREAGHDVAQAGRKTGHAVAHTSRRVGHKVAQGARATGHVVAKAGRATGHAVADTGRDAKAEVTRKDDAPRR